MMEITCWSSNKKERVLAQIGGWCICPSGMHFIKEGRCIYHVWKERLGEDDWPRHIARKEWSEGEQFDETFAEARRLLGG
jgi:hypothetical protein